MHRLHIYQEWDIERTKQGDALDDILESLGAQVVPPDFHQQSSDSSLFGSQHSADLAAESGIGSNHKVTKSHLVSPGTSPNGRGYGVESSAMKSPQSSTSPVSPSATIRRHGSVRRHGDHGGLTHSQAQIKGKGNLSHLHGAGQRNKRQDRKHWKTLRDFVDDQAIENVLETVENDRSALDVSLLRRALMAYKPIYRIYWEKRRTIRKF